VVHRRARLTPLGRLVVVERVLVHRWPAARVAEAASVSRPTVYKWVRRFLEEGIEGLNDRSSAPHRRPHALPAEAIEEILEARRRLKQGPHRLGYALGRPRSSIYGVLRRHGMARLDHLDRPTGRPIRRYERAQPGELVHVDVKKLGRIPPGGGWRKLGRGPRSTEDRRRRLGYDYLHVAIDDHSRLAFVEIHPDERAGTVVGFLARACRSFEEQGARVERLMTDNAWCYTRSPGVKQLLRDLGIRHLLIPPRRPQVNGKVERFNRTMLEEWAYATLFRSNDDRLATLQSWVETYNHHRPHTALGGRPPASRLSTT
jgi:transposase InsO family protein